MSWKKVNLLLLLFLFCSPPALALSPDNENHQQLSINSSNNLHQSNTIGAKDQDNDCSTFAYNPASGYQFYPGTSGQYTGPENYSATDGSGTLAQYCSQKDCCSGATSWVGQECSNWSTDPLVRYTICRGSCIGTSSCSSIGKKSASNSSISIGKNACRNGGNSCWFIADNTRAVLTVDIQEGACNGGGSCAGIASDSQVIEKVVVGKNACSKYAACYWAALRAPEITAVIVEKDECNSKNGACADCGDDDGWRVQKGGVQLTEACCSANTWNLPNNAPLPCNYLSQAPSLSPVPSKSMVPSSSPSLYPTSVPSLSSSPSLSSEPSQFPSVSFTPSSSTFPSSVPSEISSSQPSKDSSSPCTGNSCTSSGKLQVRTSNMILISIMFVSAALAVI